MEWVIFGGVAWVLTMLLVPLKRRKILWPLGLIGMLLIYIIDSTLIGLRAFSYSDGMAKISGLPFFYWLSSFPGGILLGYYCPSEPWPRAIYILLAALFFLALELIMFLLGYFFYINWTPVNSYILNIVRNKETFIN